MSVPNKNNTCASKATDMRVGEDLILCIAWSISLRRSWLSQARAMTSHMAEDVREGENIQSGVHPQPRQVYQHCGFQAGWHEII